MSARARGARGSASIEAVVLLPLLVLLALLVFQLGVAGWTASQTSEAAREAARAASLGRDPRAAAEQALSGALHVARLESVGDTVTVWVTVPRVSPLPSTTMERSVTIPATP